MCNVDPLSATLYSGDVSAAVCLCEYVTELQARLLEKENVLAKMNEELDGLSDVKVQTLEFIRLFTC